MQESLFVTRQAVGTLFSQVAYHVLRERVAAYDWSEVTREGGGSDPDRFLPMDRDSLAVLQAEELVIASHACSRPVLRCLPALAPRRLA